MLDRTTVDTREEPRQSDLQRMVRALEAIASGMRSQISQAHGTGVPIANVRVIPVSNVQPVRLVTGNANRTQLTLQNLDAVNEVTLGHDQGIAFGKGTRLVAGAMLSDDSLGVFRGEWWAIANVVGPVNIVVDDQG